MNLLEKLLPSLRRSPAIAQVKKDMAEEKRQNVRARDRVLDSIGALVEDFDILRAAKRRDELAHVKGPKDHRKGRP